MFLNKFYYKNIIFYSLLIIAVFSNSVVFADEAIHKKANTKLHGHLLQLKESWDLHSTEGAVSDKSEFSTSDSMLPIKGKYVVVDIATNEPDDKAVQDSLESLGMRNMSAFKYIISGELPIDVLDEAAELPGLRFIRPAMGESSVGIVTSQGDVAMMSDIVKTQLGYDGTGITIGTLSDSYDCLGGASNDVANGDLPVGILVLDDDGCTVPNTGRFKSDEGRAMMQLIADVAPGAKQSFHRATGGLANFRDGILELANAGADIIVDDFIYFAEPFFQDGMISQAVDQVSTKGVAYFSHAGNQARQSYESAFRSSGIENSNGYIAHDFDPGPDVDVLQRVFIQTGATATIILQWDQPYFSVSGKGSDSDLDITLYDVSGNTILAGSTDNNIGNDPLEIFSFTNNTNSPIFNIKIEKSVAAGGKDPAFIKYIAYSGIEIIEYNTTSGTAFGHRSAAHTISVGAAYYAETPPFGTNPPLLEAFSSAGGIPTLFDTNGNRVNFTRNKPNIVAPDGTNTTFFGSDRDRDGLPNFTGTSAAAPHAAAVAALMLEANNSLTPAEILSSLEKTAIDMDVSGYDFNTGHGYIDALAAVESVVSTPPDQIVDACQQGQTPVGNVELFIDTPVCLQDVANSGQRQMAIFVPGYRVGDTLEVSLSHGAGNGDLLHRYVGRPSRTLFDNRSNNPGNEETMLIKNVQRGWNYIHVSANTAFSDATLLLDFVEDNEPTHPTPPIQIENTCNEGATPVGNVRLSTDSPVCLQDVFESGQLQMSIYVPDDKVGSTMEILLSHGSGNATLLHRYSGRPSDSVFDHISDNTGNEERIIVENVQRSWNYIHVQGLPEFSGATLQVRFQ